MGGYRAERTEPVSSTQVEQAVGPEEIDAIALSREPAANAVTVVLPRVVDQMSPQGELPPENELDDLFGRLAQMGR